MFVVPVKKVDFFPLKTVCYFCLIMSNSRLNSCSFPGQATAAKAKRRMKL